uniref:Adenylyl cyclase-associated protein n=1 Tax=Onchocerca volvulus TaxID=6282 RepID=A0A8R1TRR8_ONCVO
MFFQSPRPFGQHSTSYRSMSNNIYSSSSMTDLQVPGPKSGRASAPPTSFASVYEDSHFGPLRSPTDHTYISNTNSEQMRISEESRFIEVIKNVEGDRSNIVSSAETSGLVSKNYEKRKTTSLHDSTNLGGTSGHSLNIFQPEVPIPISKSNIFQVQDRNVNQQPPSRVRQTQSREPQAKQTLQNLSPYHKEYHRSITSDQSNRFRSGSAVPFTEHVPKSLVIQSQRVPIYRTGGYANVQSKDEHGGFSEARVRNADKFNISQVPSNEQQQQQKPVAYQQLERCRNYATLHHVAPPKMGPFQRRTSDPSLLKINGNDLPENIAMFNVAKGVRAELEQDLKFRKKADILASRAATESVTSAFSPVPFNEQPKQSPSLQQMKNFFEKGVQQFHNVLGIERSPPVPSAKPFNVEHVRSIFRTNNTVRTESPPVATSVETEAKQDSSLSEKTTKSVIKTHETEDGISHAKLEDIQISGINSGTIIKNTESIGNAGKLIEQNTCSITEANKKYMQAKPTVFVINKPAITTVSDKSPETWKEVAVLQEQPTASQDIAILEKDYNSLVNLATSRRLNNPFPVDDTASISGSGKTQNTSSPPGILMKDGNSIRSANDLGMKTPKKVAFQCDTDNVNFTKNESKEYKTSAETPPSVVQYDDAVDEPLQKLLRLSTDIGGDLQIVGSKLSTLFAEQRNFIWLAAGQKELSANELQAQLQPLVKLMEDLSTFKESKRNTPFFNHISAASEGIQALGWLTVKPTPAPFIKDMSEASMFFVNRVLKEHKNDKMHTEWVKSWSDVLNALQKYVRQVHTTGLVWNSCPGTKPPTSIKQDSSSSTSSGNAPRPPPPVLPPDLFSAVPSGTKVTTDKSDRTALFAEINAGEEITKRLKKVTPDMQTHKNPELRSQPKEVLAATKNEGTTLATTANTSPIKKQEDKEPKMWLNNGKQWNVDYYKNNKNVIVEVKDMKQTVYIFKCENSVIQIKGKVNSITLDSCKKTSVVFDNLLSQFEVINCQSVQIQTLGAMPTLSIQKTDGCQVYLSKSAINAEIITSKSSEMNVLVPGAEDGDFVEFAVPEQFKTVYDGKKLNTTVSDIC